MKSMLTALQEGRLIELPDTDKEGALTYLAHLIEAVPDIGGNLELSEAVLAREKSQNTGLGLGVACPHIRIEGGTEIVCAVGWSPAGIDYGSPDGGKVHLVVMYLIPDSQKNAYLKEVSALARALQSAGGIRPISSAENIAVVREKLLDWVTAALEASAPTAKAKMIRLQAREAATAAEGMHGLAPAGAVRIQDVRILCLGQEKCVVLAQDAELAAQLEGDQRLSALMRQQGQFDSAGYRLVFRTSTAYGAERILYEFLAVKCQNSSQAH